MSLLAALGIKLSFKTEVRIVLATLAFILFLPLMSVVVIANAGVAIVSETLATINPVTHIISIFNPKGEKVAEFPAATVWPVGGQVTLEFGEKSPYQEHHTGIDIADPQRKIGKPITPFMEGTVTKVVNYDNEYGRYVFVDHGNHLESQYWHLSEARAKVGQHVKPGDVIGLEGETGHATGPHLHFQINVYGVPVNPRTFMIGNPPLWM